ncbi:DUF4832 domain-containing protein [uncultured Photobacterium sp.]|uniref:DUF4832 domain-containing protein n=1 Tax=uncultured Photobacterium sp. TaxID=173973 RepID=UPI002621E4A1|nr:DUF4832 domain-containing protein [uncultured Photobacterium sp.]
MSSILLSLLLTSSVIYPKKSDAILTNPGIGFTELQRIVSNELSNPFYGDTPILSYPDTSTVYYRWYWDQLTTADNPSLNEAMLKRKIDNVLQEAASVNKKVVIRFMALRGKGDPIYDADVNKDSSGIPCWLVEELYGHGLNGTSCHLSDKEAVNMFKNPLFIHRTQQFLSALGKRYDNNQALLRIDVGMVGSWGEWNLSGYASKSSLSVAMADNGYRVQDLKPYIDFIIKAFPHTPKVMLGTNKGDYLSYATQKGLGWRVDCLGDWNKGWNHMEDGYPTMISHMTDASVNKYPDMLFNQRWKKSAVDFEICQGSLQDWHNIKNPQRLTYNQVRQTFDFALKQHASLINAKSGAIPEQYQLLVKQFLNKLGYRYQLNKLEVNNVVHNNDYIYINSTWENVGVAPSYRNYPVTWRLRSINGDIVAYYTSMANIVNWLPADNDETKNPIYIITDKFKVNNIPAGEYFLDVGLVDIYTRKAKISLAIDTKLTDDNGNNYVIDKNKKQSKMINRQQYIEEQNNIGRWNEITMINVI